ncbi:MAG: hypothetical protein R3300_20625, partial [Candidatus Promineifilaceae bacterium]|nr:hypothetical protein [Candidatus Promineifilaceae bacterium]
MSEVGRLDADTLDALVQAADLQALTVAQIFDLFREEKALHPYLPDATYEVDPRDGALVTFSSARARRPHDYVVPEEPTGEQDCPICQGQTTGVIDVAPLSEGHTFINKNLFPILRVLEKIEPEALEQARHDGAPMMKRATYGLHFLQWTSSLHDCDWHNMTQADRVVVLERLAALECKLLFDDHQLMPPAEPWDPQTKARGYVSIIKNYGAPVGGSLAHGHQQIAYSNIMPRRIHNNWTFF